MHDNNVKLISCAGLIRSVLAARLALCYKFAGYGFDSTVDPRGLERRGYETNNAGQRGSDVMNTNPDDTADQEREFGSIVVSRDSSHAVDTDLPGRLQRSRTRVCRIFGASTCREIPFSEPYTALHSPTGSCRAGAKEYGRDCVRTPA